MESSQLLNKALDIIKIAENNSGNFHSMYSQFLRATGESSADYSLYEIELSEDYLLVIDFVDFSISDFSIVHRSHTKYIAWSANEEVES